MFSKDSLGKFVKKNKDTMKVSENLVKAIEESLVNGEFNNEFTSKVSSSDSHLFDELHKANELLRGTDMNDYYKVWYVYPAIAMMLVYRLSGNKFKADFGQTLSVGYSADPYGNRVDTVVRLVVTFSKVMSYEDASTVVKDNTFLHTFKENLQTLADSGDIGKTKQYFATVLYSLTVVNKNNYMHLGEEDYLSVKQMQAERQLASGISSNPLE